jgi:hypothetical protein
MNLQYKSRVRFLNKGGASENEQAQASFYQTLTANYNTEFAKYNALSDSLQAQIQPIINAGQGQYGFSAGEDSALRSSATNADSKSFQNDDAALNNKLTQQNGGMSDLPNGAHDQLEQQLGTQEAQANATDQNNITQAGYAQGTQNYNNAMNEQFSLLSGMNPNSYASSANASGSDVNGAVQAEAAENNGWMSVVGGALGGVGSVIGGGLAGGKICWIAEVIFGVDDARTELVREWLNVEFGVRHWYGRATVFIYRLIGKPLAWLLSKVPSLQVIFRPLFEKALAEATKWKAGI